MAGGVGHQGVERHAFVGGMLVDDDQLSAPFAEDVGVRDLAEDAKVGVPVDWE